MYKRGGKEMRKTRTLQSLNYLNKQVAKMILKLFKIDTKRTLNYLKIIENV